MHEDMSRCTDLSGYRHSVPVLWETHGSFRQKWALWRAERASRRADRLKLRHRLHRFLAALLGGGA